jgi:acetyltransferase-like isoleucine patch superfamily enzyme
VKESIVYEIHAEEVVMGRNVVIEDGAILQGRTTKLARRISIGDHVFIGANTRSYVDVLEIGDYSAIHNHGFIAGDQPCIIGTCGWFGQHTIFNSTGGLTIGNGVGVGAYSQLWSHIRHGDVLQGCRFNSTKPLVIEDDVWFVGHCIVSPIVAKKKSMAMVGSVVTGDMEENHVYAGVPAKDVTEKIGPQFSDVPLDKKHRAMAAKLDEFYALHPEFKRGEIRVVRSLAEEGGNEGRSTVFDVATRTYNRRRTPQEFAFMRLLLQDLTKFFPRS